MWEFELAVSQSHAWQGNVAGLDEAGRGPLAGPVVAAAVVLPRGLYLPRLNDSKALSSAARADLATAIRTQAIGWAIAETSPAEIDQTNILAATHTAMRRAVAGLAIAVAGVVVDGLPVRSLGCAHAAIPKGDAKCPSIAAASILAKCHRDEQMAALDSVYPGYGFAQHKGYPTPEHVAALGRLGPCPIHRVSFRWRHLLP
jgi:ribonuclease HII